jgi:hypothetical protein
VLISAFASSASLGLSMLQRPLAIAGEETLARVCSIKNGGCILIMLFLTLTLLPSKQLACLLSAWRGLGATLLLDTLLLGFVRMPVEERHGCWALARVLRRVGRQTSDYLPCAVFFFLWLASSFVITMASLIPCLVLLFREAARDISTGRHRHGSIQMVLLVVRILPHLGAVFLAVWGQDSIPQDCTLGSLIEYGFSCLWLVVELLIFFDLVTQGWLTERCVTTVCCAQIGVSQVMWLLAILGQAALVHTSKKCMHTERLPCYHYVQNIALMSNFHLFTSIHLPEFCRLVRSAWQTRLRLLIQVHPDQVVFIDRPLPPELTHRSRIARCISKAWRLFGDSQPA